MYYKLLKEDSYSLLKEDGGYIILEPTISLRSPWRFLIRNPSGEYVASLVNARKREFRERLNQGGSASFVLDATDDCCTDTILAVGQNDLIIEYKGIALWGGQLVSRNKIAEGDDIYWEVVAKQFFNLFEKRYCGYNKSTGISDPREFEVVDAGEIAWTLIDESQDEVNGDWGITRGTIQPSLARTKSYEKANIAEAILELADNEYGFDFEITPGKVFNVYYPMKGVVKDGVVFRYPQNCTRIESLEDSWEIVNHELGLGRHWGGEEIYYVADDATSQGTYKKREKIESYKDVEVQAFLTDMVEEDIAWLKGLNKVIKFSSRVDDKTDLTEYSLGDMVRVVADIFDVDDSFYVYERVVKIGEDNEPDVSLTLGD